MVLAKIFLKTPHSEFETTFLRENPIFHEMSSFAISQHRKYDLYLQENSLDPKPEMSLVHQKQCPDTAYNDLRKVDRKHPEKNKFDIDKK